MKAIDLALKDLRQIVRDWRAAFFLVIMPVAFTIMFGFAFGGFGNDEPADSRLPVGLIDQDQGALSGYLRGMLENSKVIRVEVVNVGVDEAGELVADDEYAAIVVVPPDFSEQLLDGNTRSIRLIADASSNAGRTSLGEVQAATMRLVSAVTTASQSSQIYDREVGFSDSNARQLYFEVAVLKTIEAWDEPPVNVVAFKSTAVSLDPSNVTESDNAFSQSSPGMMAQFAIAGLMGASTILVLERKNRSMRRLLTTSISRVEILLGHYLAMFIMIFVQVLILIVFGQLLLRLDYFSHPAATLLLAVATALFAASLGLLIGTVAKTEEQVIVFAMIPMFVLSGFGGAWVPLEITPEAFQQIARLTPLAFVVDGFQDIIIRGLGFQEVLLNILILLLYAVILFIFAAWRFRYE